MDWELRRRLSAEIQSGPWSQWVTTARKPKALVLREAEDKIAKRLGLPFIPKDGMLSLGWIVQQLDASHHSHPWDQTTPVFQVVRRLSPLDRHGNPGIASTATLVFALMCHRELLTKHAYNDYSHHGRTRNMQLFESHWTMLAEEVLGWLMLQPPFGELSKLGDEYISSLTVGGDGRLHSTDGPVVTTTAGRSLYALNNVLMTAAEFAMRGDARRILELQNLEVRRVLVEDMGTEGFIRSAGLRPIHSDETGKLYRLDGQDDGWRVNHLCWVHVMCPSTGREYMLAVPPRTRTAREGVAWTFRKLPEEYNPMEQT